MTYPGWKKSIVLLLAAFALLALGGCASVEGTAIYYTPTTLNFYPPKPKDWPVPILGKAPNESYQTIGRLAFQSDLGFRFMRRAIEYNARVNGADAVILKDVAGRREVFLTRVPPRVDWVPFYGGGPYGYYGPGFVRYYPIWQPGYVQANEALITSIDAEMIVVTARPMRFD